MELTKQQQKAVNEINHNLQIIACAGSGKTEVITRRIANILLNKPEVLPENLVAFTFTEKAAQNMQERIKKVLNENEEFNSDTLENMYIGTIHGFCYQILKDYCEEFKDFKILDTVKNYLYIKRYYNECGMKDLNLEFNRFNIKLFLDCIDKLIYDYDNYEEWDEANKKALESYKKSLYEKKYFDFSLLIHEALKQLKENKNILKNIKYLIVDEYQDVDDLQEEIIQCFYNNGVNICVVGDDDQTIYRFRGSNANNMIHFADKYADVVQIKLEDNFRSEKAVIDVADTVISQNQHRLEKSIKANRNNQGKVIAKRFESIREQNEYIASEIKQLKQNGIAYKDIAILVRKGKFIAGNEKISGIAEALNQYEIPYEANSAEYFFQGNYYLKIIKTLEILTNFNKSDLYDCWKDCISQENFNQGFRYLRKIASSNISLVEDVKKFLELIGFFDETGSDYEERMEMIEGVIGIFTDYDEIYKDYQLTAKINGLIKFLEEEAAEQYKYKSFKKEDENEDKVQVMTVHKAKGLEYYAVFLPNLEENEFPSKSIGGKKYWHVLGNDFEQKKEKFEGDEEDERKLFYVAVTRAKEKLYLTYQLKNNDLSVFVKEAYQSKYLDIDQEDLNYFEVRRREVIEMMEQERMIQKVIGEVRREQAEDLYVASHFVGGGAYLEAEQIRKMSDEEIMQRYEKQVRKKLGNI